MRNSKSRNGFTLIELIIVMVILGIMAAVAVPRYLDSISNAEEAAEDAVISSIRAGLTQYANNSLYESGRAEWPDDPFKALSEKPAGYSDDGAQANVDGEWTFIPNGTGGTITHQRADNSRYQWEYDKGIQDGVDDAKIGSLGPRTAIAQTQD
jgi:prepilin-type N-terminal cleavage/methylation domain-containing protein